MFQDRADAGFQLAQKLKIYKDEHPLILALPRGGVPIGYEIARVLKAPLDVFVVRKVGAPWNPEFGIGAVAPGIQILEQDSLKMLGIRPSEVTKLIEREQEEVRRRQKLYQQDKDFLPLTGKAVILVDDGVATGVTTRAAIQALKILKPRKLVLAVPVGPADTIHALRQLVDELACLDIPSLFYAVGAFYENFPQVSDEEVIRLLKTAKEERKNDNSSPSSCTYFS
jgi:putative phosphoribosyl transferase